MKKGKKRKSVDNAARNGESKKPPRKVFEKGLRALQVELCHLQEHVKKEGLTDPGSHRPGAAPHLERSKFG